MCKAMLKALSVALGKQLRRREWTGRLEERRRGGPGRVSGSRRCWQFRCCRDRGEGGPGRAVWEAWQLCPGGFCGVVRAELADPVT